MAIIFYPDYKEASERHLETCLQLENILKTRYQAKSILTVQERKDMKFLLSNLYYLSGYIIECIYNFSIFKNIGFPNDVDIKQLKYLRNGNPIHSIPCAVAFRKYDGTPSNAFIIASDGGHKLFGKMGFFQTYYPISNASLIPLLDGNPLKMTRPCRDLFSEWDVYKRYKIDINLGFINTFDFFDLSIEVYEGVIKYL